MRYQKDLSGPGSSGPELCGHFHRSISLAARCGVEETSCYVVSGRSGRGTGYIVNTKDGRTEIWVDGKTE
jgi:hypothetical protein